MRSIQHLPLVLKLVLVTLLSGSSGMPVAVGWTVVLQPRENMTPNSRLARFGTPGRQFVKIGHIFYCQRRRSDAEAGGTKSGA